MRKSLASFALLGTIGVAAAALPGCNSSWWQNFQNDPVEQVQSFETSVQVGLNAAQLAWPAILAALPPANQAAANTQFVNGIAAVNHGLQALNDAVAADVAAQGPTPNFVSLMQAVSDAMGQIIAIVDLYNGSAPPAGDAGAPSVGKAPAAAPSIADLRASYKGLSRWGVKLKS